MGEKMCKSIRLWLDIQVNSWAGRLKEVGTTNAIKVEGAYSEIKSNPDAERKHLDSGYKEKLW